MQTFISFNAEVLTIARATVWTAIGCLSCSCAFGAESPPAAATTPTYLRDVLPIIMGKCSRCHNEQAKFVYNWLDYRTAFADRWEIKRRVWDSWKGTYFKESMPIANSPESFALTDKGTADHPELGN